LLTSAGGVVTYQGSYVSVLIDGGYSIKVTDSIGDQVYYVANVQGTIHPALNDYNLAANGSFEVDSNNDGIPDDWDITIIPTGSVAIDSTTRIAGTSSLQFISAGAGAGDAVSEVFFEINELRGIRVLFSLISSIATIRNLVEVIWYDSNQLQISTSIAYDNSTTNDLVWTDNVSQLTPPPAATFAKIRLSGAHPSSSVPGSAWMDNVVVTSTLVASSAVEPMIKAVAAPRETGAITAATANNPVAITQIAHGYSAGDLVYISKVVGMTEINNLEFTIAILDADNYTLGVDGSTYTAYVSGGISEIDEYLITTTPAISIFTDGEIFIFRANNPNVTSTPVIDVNGLGRKPFTKWGGKPLNTKDVNSAEHDIIIRYSSINDGYEFVNVSGGKESSIIEDGEVATGTGIIPLDASIPQIGEGDMRLSVTVNPASTDNKFVVTSQVNVASNTAATSITSALFRDSELDAITAVSERISQLDGIMQLNIEYEFDVLSLSATTFSIRIGSDVAATTTFNGEAGVRLLGGVLNSYLRVTEVKK